MREILEAQPFDNELFSEGLFQWLEKDPKKNRYILLNEVIRPNMCINTLVASVSFLDVMQQLHEKQSRILFSGTNSVVFNNVEEKEKANPNEQQGALEVALRFDFKNIFDADEEQEIIPFPQNTNDIAKNIFDLLKEHESEFFIDAAGVLVQQNMDELAQKMTAFTQEKSIVFINSCHQKRIIRPGEKTSKPYSSEDSLKKGEVFVLIDEQHKVGVDIPRQDATLKGLVTVNLKRNRLTGRRSSGLSDAQAFEGTKFSIRLCEQR